MSRDEHDIIDSLLRVREICAIAIIEINRLRESQAEARKVIEALLDAEEDTPEEDAAIHRGIDFLRALDGASSRNARAVPLQLPKLRTCVHGTLPASQPCPQCRNSPTFG